MWVLWIVIFAGCGGAPTLPRQQTFDTKELCEAAASDFVKMRFVHDRLALAASGRTVFAVDHMCVKGSEKRQRAD